MAIRKKIVADDGLTRVEEIDLSRATLKELRSFFPKGAGGFEWKIQEIEAFWNTHLSHTRTKPKPLSLAWYARRIVWSIAHARDAIASGRADRLEAAVLAGLAVGQLHEEARRRVNWGEHVRRYRKNTATARANAKKPRAANVEKIEAEALRLRETTPYDRSDYSTRWLNQTIARRLHISPSTVGRRLTALKIK